jgi:putative addiction module component (TIGR02574 family)
MSKIDLHEDHPLDPSISKDRWDALDDGSGQLSNEQYAVLLERIEAHRRAPETSIPWEIVRERLRALG